MDTPVPAPVSSACPACREPIAPAWYFCANCSRMLRPKPFKVSIAAVMGIFALSILLPPLGLWPGIKYLRRGGQEARMIGMIAIVLTVISSVITVWLCLYYLQMYLSIYADVLY